MSSTYDLSSLLDLPFDVSLITHALEHEKEASAWDLWRSLYPNFSKDTFVSFDQFMEKIYRSTQKYDDMSFEEVQNEMLLLVESYEREEGR